MRRAHFEVGETAVTVISDEPFIQVAKDAIFAAREILQSKIIGDPFFKTTFEQYPVLEEDDPLIRRMCASSSLAGVGPMAGVAGAVATYAVEAMVASGAEFAIVENGGDIAIRTDREVTVGVFADDELLKDVAFRIPRTDRIIGVCSSSGRVGPSVSFGNSGICTVFSDDVILADECATALGNMIRKGGSAELSDALERIGNIDGVDGCVACSNGLVAMFGDVPEIVKAKIDKEKITKIVFNRNSIILREDYLSDY